jgi:hypothetical protein
MKTDSRYTISRECTGSPHGKQYVARFAREYLGATATRTEARALVTSHAFKRACDGVTDLRVIPALSYRLAGAGYVRVSSRHVYPATVAGNQPDHVKREAVFVNGILLERGEYFAIPSR